VCGLAFILVAWGDTPSIGGILGVAMGIIILVAGLFWWTVPELFVEFDDLESIKQERNEIKQKLKNDQHDIFQIIDLNLNQVSEYYTINKAQARISFMYSIFAITIGLLTIIAGIWLRYLGKIEFELSFLTGVAGIISEFIGVSCFFLYKKSLEQLNSFFNQLMVIQDTMLAINLARNLSTPESKNEIETKIISTLLERSIRK